MPETDSEFCDLIKRLQAGDDEAGEYLVEVFGPHIMRVVRRRLDRRLQSKFDASDFRQDVYLSLLRKKSINKLANNPSRLAAYLANMARNKVVDQFRKRVINDKYDVNKEYSLHHADKVHPNALGSNDPTASQVAIANEIKDDLLASLTPKYRNVVLLKQNGATYTDIARTLKIDRKTVRRVIERLRQRTPDE